MFLMMNKVILIGRLTRDPELRYTTTGKAVANFGLAVDRQFKNANGEREADFINIVVWGKIAEVCANNLGKGRLVAIDGRLQIRNYEDNNGNKRYVSEVVANEVRFLDWPKDHQGQGSRPQQGSAGAPQGPSGTPDDFDLPPAFDEDDIPF
jgi:single-strand DNA-binding protein